MIYIYIVQYLLHIYKHLLNDTVIAIVADEKRSLPSHLAQTQPVAGPVPPVEDERLCRLCFSNLNIELAWIY